MNNLLYFSISSTKMENLANHIKNVCKLPLFMDDPTPGKRNHSFASICQQLKRPEFGLQNLYKSAQELRKKCASSPLREKTILLLEWLIFTIKFLRILREYKFLRILRGYIHMGLLGQGEQT